MTYFVIHWAIPGGLFIYLLACLFLDCEHVSVETKQQEDTPCEIKDNVRGRAVFLGFLLLLALVWIITPLKK
jgi:hypothetical protein